MRQRRVPIDVREAGRVFCQTDFGDLGEAGVTELSSLLAERDQTGPSAALAMTEHDSITTVPGSETVLAVDRWGRRRGADLSAEWQELEAGEVEPLIAADAHASLFEPSPRFSERPHDVNRAAWWRQLMETSEYQSLRAQTVLDTSLSGLAAKSLCDQWQEYAVELDKRPQPKDGSPAPGADDEPIADHVARIRSTAKACAAARETVSTAQDMAAGLGLGGAGGTLDQKALATYFRRVRNDDTLRKILEFAGKAIRRCRALQRTKTTASRGELTGIELGGDVSRLVPWEMAQVAGAVPEVETLALYRLAQRRSLCYRQHRVERLGSGPIVIVVDESGSMRGEKIIAAKGIALALAWLARQQNRWAALVGFSDSNVGTRLACPPRATDQAALIEWLEHFYGDGTTLDVPIEELPNNYWREFVARGLQRGKTDVVILTDAIVEVEADMVDNYRRWAAAEQVTTLGIVIGEREAGSFADVCDRHWCVENLDLDAGAVQEVLSI
ncbi:MAG TPA: hypothetical protein VF278_05260 [Pirellulales bacterium]